jgi:hypothetical protein
MNNKQAKIVRYLNKPGQVQLHGKRFAKFQQDL